MMLEEIAAKSNITFASAPINRRFGGLVFHHSWLCLTSDCVWTLELCQYHDLIIMGATEMFSCTDIDQNGYAVWMSNRTPDLWYNHTAKHCAVNINGDNILDNIKEYKFKKYNILRHNCNTFIKHILDKSSPKYDIRYFG